MTPVRSQVVGQMDRADLIRTSLRCFMMGLFGMLPVIGIPMAIMAMVDYCRAKSGRGIEWNPAQRYLSWGLALAVFSFLLWGLLALVVINLIALGEWQQW
jgi:hypothetical protein